VACLAVIVLTVSLAIPGFIVGFDRSCSTSRKCWRSWTG
jgi:hypothetical protein